MCDLMSSEVWYYELLSKSVILGKSEVYHPHFDVFANKFLKENDDSAIITQNKCVIEFYKPLVTNYRSFVKSKNEKGFTLNELCYCISDEWSKIIDSFSEWIDDNDGQTNYNVIDELYVYTGDNNITRVIVNFNVPMEKGISPFEDSNIEKLPFVIAPTVVTTIAPTIVPTIITTKTQTNESTTLGSPTIITTNDSTITLSSSTTVTSPTSICSSKKVPLKTPKKKRKTNKKASICSDSDNNDLLADQVISNLMKRKMETTLPKMPKKKTPKTTKNQNVSDLMTKYDK